jgi:hypothetical protein
MPKKVFVDPQKLSEEQNARIGVPEGDYKDRTTREGQ